MYHFNVQSRISPPRENDPMEAMVEKELCKHVSQHHGETQLFISVDLL